MKPTRLWWSLDEVLPLAEHAMAVPGHQLTGAQVAAWAPTQPALIWTSTPADGLTPGGDWLDSNGSPGWFDPDGSIHQAQPLVLKVEEARPQRRPHMRAEHFGIVERGRGREVILERNLSLHISSGCGC